MPEQHGIDWVSLRTCWATSRRPARRWRRLFKRRPSILTSRPPGRIWETFVWVWKICPLPGSAYERSLADFPKGQLANRSRFGLGRTLADLGEIDLATKRFSDLAAQGSSDWTDRALLQLGKTQLAGGRYDPAVKTLETLDRPGTPQRTEGRGHLVRAEACAGSIARQRPRRCSNPWLPRAPKPWPRKPLWPWRHSSWRTVVPITLSPRSTRRQAVFHNRRWLRHFCSGRPRRVKLKRTDEARKRFLKVAETYPGDPWADDAVARSAPGARCRRSRGCAVPCKVVSRAVSAEQVQGRRSLDRGQGPVSRRATPEGGHHLEALLGLGNEPGTRARTAGSQLSPAALPRARYDLALAYRAAGKRFRPTPCSPVWPVRPGSRLVWTRNS